MKRAPLFGLYAVADCDGVRESDLPAAVAQVIEGGARIVQLRDKTDPARRARLAARIAPLCADHDVPFLVNDDLELALDLGCGVHLGRDDAAVGAARERLGPEALIGASCYDDLDRAARAAAAGASYVAFGRFFPSRTKPQATPADIALLGRARAALALPPALPIVAIGGVTPDNGALLIRAGADALAVVEGLFGAPDIREQARRFTRLFEEIPS